MARERLPIKTKYFRKAIIVKPSEEGSNDKRFPHALVAGIDRYLGDL